jgi:hypothetical protein
MMLFVPDTNRERDREDKEGQDIRDLLYPI